MTSNNLRPTTTDIIVKGYILVNIPVTVIILGIWYVLWKMLDVEYTISVLIAFSVGWFYCSVSIKKWIRWVSSFDMNNEQILKIGRLSLLLWNRSTIDKALRK